jgi:hypothetical protein
LDFVIAGAGEERRVQRPNVRRQPFRSRDAVGVLPLSRFSFRNARRPARFSGEGFFQYA